jgi:dihydrofolate synthase/folylpolyglutamate synthase
LYYDILKNGNEYLAQVKLPLSGLYQQKNIPGVIATLEILKASGFDVNEQSIRDGLEHVVTQTNFKGRWQKLSDAPLMICDTAHNINGIAEVVKQIRQQKVGHVHIVLGLVKDKDVMDILNILPKDASYYFCQAKIPRAMDANVLAEKARTAGLNGEVLPDVNEAIRRALVFAQENHMIFIGGSTFIVAEIDGI